jgi:murein DD-endopeptidase MepM/ murein hydrolase activator NlpD
MMPGPVRRPVRLVAVLAGAIGLLVVLCCGGVATAFVYQSMRDEAARQAADQAQGQNGGCGGKTVDVAAKLPSVSSLSQEQIRNAAVIISVGQQMNIPPRGWIIAIATALQESTLHNYGNLGSRNDHDSLGLFQQRPSMGWGTPAQVMDPAYAARKFYERLLQVSGWQALPLTSAAQRVQRSAFPDAYAKHEPLATVVVNSLTNGAGRAVGSLTTLRCAAQRQIAASGWTNPVPGSHVVSGFRTPSRPTHNGDDLSADRRTPIYAASAGIVTLAKCDAATIRTNPGGCDRDGGLNVKGCGWYVEVLHAGNIITRYCHMLVRPMVTVGQAVRAGQQIGIVGTTGHSSGPHCHFEVHLNGDRSFSGAVDPAPFMRDRGAPLGGAA